MLQMNPQQQEWWQKFLQDRQASFQQQLQTLHGLQPWQHPGWSPMPNPLLSRASSPLLQQTAPQAGTMPYFMGGGGEGVSSPMNPMLMQMLLTGATGFGGQ
jgi:hypothetical protein